VLLSRQAAERLASAAPAESIRDVIGAELGDLEVADPGVLDDVDAPEALARINATRPPSQSR
jgi:CTP:molybdopterin cytidylyltransferase MocA